MSYRVEIEKATGEITYWNSGQNFGDKEDADERAEYLWNVHGHTGNFARFSVIDSDGETYSDWEC